MATSSISALGNASLEDAIKRAFMDVFPETSQQSSAEYAKAVRIAVQAFGDVKKDVLLRALQSPDVLEDAIEEAVERSADKKANRGRKKARGNRSAPIKTLGEAEDVRPLTDAQGQTWLEAAAKPLDGVDPSYITISTTEASELLDATRATIGSWIKAGKLLAFQGAKRGWRVPKEQIRRRKIAPGLKDVQSHFDDAELTWHFLVSVQEYQGRSVRPLDLLFENKISDVEKLAEGYGSDYL